MRSVIQLDYGTGEFTCPPSNLYSWTDDNEDGIIDEDEKEYLNYTVTHAETWYESMSASAVDDGSGNITGTAFSGKGHINYGTGEITGTLTADSSGCTVIILSLRYRFPALAFDGKRQRKPLYRSTWKS